MDKLGFFPKNFSWGVIACTLEVVHLFMRYMGVFAASAQYDFLLVHHSSSGFYNVPVFPLRYAVLLRRVTARDFSSDTFFSEIRCELIRKVFFAYVWSKAACMPARGFFYFGFELLEVSEHFALFPHMVNLGMPWEVVNERHIVAKTTDSYHWVGPNSPYIWVNYIQCLFAHIPLFREQLMMLFVEWKASRTPTISFSLKAETPMTTPFDYIPLSFWRSMWPIHLCHNSMLASLSDP